MKKFLEILLVFCLAVLLILILSVDSFSLSAQPKEVQRGFLGFMYFCLFAPIPIMIYLEHKK